MSKSSTDENQGYERMVTTTTKTLNHSIEKPNSLNAVNCTITSTPGLNLHYFTKSQGFLKLVQLVFTIIAIGLVASRIRYEQPVILDPTGKSPAYSFKREILMQAESYFLSANFAILTTLIVFLLSFLSDNLSFMLISKTSTMNKIMNVALALLALTAGVMEIAQEERWKVDESTGKRTMSDLDESTRVAAGYITVLNGVLFLVGYALARRDFSLKPENVDAERFTVETTAPGRQNL